MMRRLVWIVIATAITFWQVRAGIARCGAIDGGVLLLPLLVALGYLISGVRRDLKDIFAGQASRNKTHRHVVSSVCRRRSLKRHSAGLSPLDAWNEVRYEVN